MRKGMSQTLTLIVAASVLMMTALSIIFMVQGAFGDVNEGTGQTTCTSTIATICSGANTVPTPNSCVDDQGQPIPGAPPQVQGPDSVIDCREFQGR